MLLHRLFGCGDPLRALFESAEQRELSIATNGVVHHVGLLAGLQSLAREDGVIDSVAQPRRGKQSDDADHAREQGPDQAKADDLSAKLHEDTP